MDCTLDAGDGVTLEMFLDGTLTTILVGDEKKKYHVHKALLCKLVGYFASAYRTNMQECVNDTFHIKDVSELAFRSLISWVYTGKVFLDPGSQPALDVEVAFLADDGLNGDDEYEGEPVIAETMKKLESWRVANPGAHWINAPEMYDDGYDAVSETDSAMDYEYDEGPAASVSEDAPSDEVLEEGRSDDEHIDQTEQSVVAAIFPRTAIADLDTYQLNVLLGIANSQELLINEEEYTFKPYVTKWTAMLEQKLQDEGNDLRRDRDEEQSPGAFELLMELYIVADRFDVPILRGEVLDLLQAEHNYQLSVIGGTALPPFDVVTKTLENLPPKSNLRRWLVHIFAYRWSPTADTPEERLARERLPQDFLLDLAMALAERASWISEAVPFPMYSTYCLCCPEQEICKEETARIDHHAAQGGPYRRASP